MTSSHRLSPRWRKIALIAHVVVSVGWLGTAYFMAVLALVAAYSTAVPRQGAFELLRQATDGYVMIPMSLLALGTGLLVSLGTQWGLVRHYWVVVKFVATLAAMLFGAGYLSRQLALAAMTSADPAADVRPAAWGIALGSIGMCGVLLFATTLSVRKPWGRTARGRRMLNRR